MLRRLHRDCLDAGLGWCFSPSTESKQILFLKRCKKKRTTDRSGTSSEHARLTACSYRRVTSVDARGGIFFWLFFFGTKIPRPTVESERWPESMQKNGPEAPILTVVGSTCTFAHCKVGYLVLQQGLQGSRVDPFWVAIKSTLCSFIVCCLADLYDNCGTCWNCSRSCLQERGTCHFVQLRTRIEIRGSSVSAVKIFVPLRMFQIDETLKEEMTTQANKKYINDTTDTLSKAWNELQYKVEWQCNDLS